MSIGETIRKKRIHAGMSLEELAVKIGISRQTLSRYETGVIANIPSDKIESLAKILKTTPAYLMGWANENDTLEQYDNISPIQTKKFPLLGKISCGEPVFANEDRESYVEAGTNIQADFCLKAKGDSMINARIYDGDIVFIRKQEMVSNGEIAAVIIDDEATLKRVYFYPDKHKLILNPENPKYEPYVYINEELNEIHILGKAVAFQSDVI